MQIFRVHGGLSYLEFVPYFRKTTIYVIMQVNCLSQLYLLLTCLLHVYIKYKFLFSHMKRNGKKEKIPLTVS